MPSKKTHVMPSGATYDFVEYGIADLVDPSYIRSELPRMVMATYINPDHVGRKLDKMAEKVGKVIVRDMMRYIVDRLMQSDRLMLPYGKQLYIGVIPDNPKRIAKKHKLRNLCLETGGKRFGVRMDGTKENYYFRMPRRRRTELATRLLNNQWFIGRV